MTAPHTFIAVMWPGDREQAVEVRLAQVEDATLHDVGGTVLQWVAASRTAAWETDEAADLLLTTGWTADFAWHAATIDGRLAEWTTTTNGLARTRAQHDRAVHDLVRFFEEEASPTYGRSANVMSKATQPRKAVITFGRVRGPFNPGTALFDLNAQLYVARVTFDSGAASAVQTVEEWHPNSLMPDLNGEQHVSRFLEHCGWTVITTDPEWSYGLLGREHIAWAAVAPSDPGTDVEEDSLKRYQLRADSDLGRSLTFYFRGGRTS